MLRAIALLLLTFALTGAASAQESPREELPLTIGIHDYAHVPGGAVSHATRIVTRVYEQIGVRTNWLGVVRPDERKAGSANRTETPAGQIAQMTIIMLTPKMAARGHIGDDVLGFAAVSNEGMGRIAYVVYDRLRDTAQQAATSVDDLLAFVLAHEIARLLLPADSASSAGLMMKNRWTIEEIRRLDVRRLGFSTLQASLMRTTIEDDGLVFAARAAREGSR